MAVKTRTEIKAFFETGDIPTELQFIDTWDSVRFQSDGIAVSSDFSGDGTTGSPVTPIKATLQATLSIDDLIALSGVADGSISLGTFTGSTITDSRNIKQAIQELETALEAIGGGSTAAEDDLTSTVVTAKVYRNGGTATTISTPAAGQYNLSIKSGAAFRGADVFANNTVLDGSNQFILRIDNSINGEDRWPLVQLYDVNTGALVDQQATSTNHSIGISGNITTITFPGMNLFGSTGFMVIVR